MHFAAEYYQAQMVKFLLAQPGIDVNAVTAAGYTPLHYIADRAKSSSIEIAEMLLAMPNVNVNCVNDVGRTPLHCAAKFGRCDTVALLLATPGIDVGVADAYMETPLHAAVFGGAKSRAAVVRMLVAAAPPNSLVDAADAINHRTVLHYAVSKGDRSVVEVLLAVRDIDLSVVDSGGRTASDVARRRGRVRIYAKLLLAHASRRIRKLF